MKHSSSSPREQGEPCFLGLGSNLGDRLGHLRHALRLLPREGVAVARCSAVYETEPWGPVEQPPFLNLVCAVQTPLLPQELLAAVKRVEQAVGRRPQPERYGPREIDIDILLCGEATVSEQGLEVPHPRMAERAFVLVPLVELAPGLRHPVLGLPLKDLLAGLPDQEGVRLFGPPLL